MKNIEVKELRTLSPELNAGDKVLLSGIVYTSRDAAHKRITELIAAGSPLPYELDGAVIYYAGPTGTKDGMVIGSCGPTTFLDRGLAAMIGKGERSQPVIDAIERNKAVYFCAIGGAGALACKCIKSCEVIAFEDLGCESVKKLYIEDFPLTVAVDCHGGNIFTEGRKKYCKL